MAAPIAEANAVSSRYFDGKLKQGVYEDSPFLNILKSKGNVKKKIQGTELQFPVRLQKLNQSKRTDPRSQVIFTGKETRTAGVLPWSYYDAVTTIHWDERVQNQGDSKLVDLIKDKSMELSEDMSELMAETVFSDGSDTLGMVPLSVIIDSSLEYAGIDPADYPVWASHEDNVTTILTLQALRFARNSATFGKDRPTHHITTRDLFSKMESLIQPQGEIIESKEMAKLGYDSIAFYNNPVVADVFCPEGEWYGIDMRQFKMYEVPGYGPSNWFGLEQAGFPNAMAKYLSHVCQLACKSRRSSFKFTNLDASA